MEEFEISPLSKRVEITVDAAAAEIFKRKIKHFWKISSSSGLHNNNYYFSRLIRRNKEESAYYCVASQLIKMNNNSSLSSISFMAAIDNNESIIDPSSTNIWDKNLPFDWHIQHNSSSFWETFIHNVNQSTLFIDGGAEFDGDNLTGKIICGKWEPAQHNIFQVSNMCFLSAFVIPRLYKSSILLFRLMLCLSFFITSIWAGAYICAFDSFIWGAILCFVNSVHTIILLYKFLPPALSLELTELYIRMFKPLKVSKKHFKELTKEATLLRLEAGEIYATEDVTLGDERLSILIKGRLNVTCNSTYMHNISCYQFIDSPEWKGNSTASGVRFQVTITAEEDSTYLCWQRLKLDRVLRHRPQISFVLNSLIGKDITLKMYSLNEQVGHMCTTEAMSRAAKEDHWRRSINRSASVDAVHTGTKGHVRSISWKQSEKQNRKSSTYSECESPLLGGEQQCWVPIMASQFPAENPFIRHSDTDSQDEERIPPMISSNQFPNRNKEQQHEQIQLATLNNPTRIESSVLQQISLLNLSTATNSMMTSQPVALIPVIVPVYTTTTTTTSINTTNPNRTMLKQTRGVKFDETCL